jgi:hypothetical protein
MKKVIPILMLSFLILLGDRALAQSSKGFDYAAHRKMNKKAGHWGKRRVKAADHDMTNIQCSVGKSRRKARRSSRQPH